MEAEKEYRRIRNAVAFTIQGATRRNVNQHMRAYEFPDGSILYIHRKGFARVAKAHGDYQTMIVGKIRANAFGVAS